MYRKSIGKPQRFLFKRIRRQRSAFWHTYNTTIKIAGYVCGALILMQIIIHSIIYADRYDIEKITVHHQNNTTTQELQIEEIVSEKMAEHSSYLVLRRWHRHDIRSSILSELPLVSNVTLANFDENVLIVDIQYHQPRIIRHLSNGARFGSYDEYVYPLSTGHTISSGGAMLYLPGYLAGIDSLDGIYHETPETDLAHVYHTVNSKIPLKHMIVYPGAGYVAMMTVDDLKVLFSLRKPIDDQMLLYSQIYEHYPEAYRIRQIDVGSLDDAIVTLE